MNKNNRNTQHTKKRIAFTLIELLVVISIMVIIAGIGVRGYKRMSGEMALRLTETQVRQVVTSTVLEAKRNRIPMQIQVHVPGNINSKPCIISGGIGSLVAFWDFEGNQAKKGLRRLHFQNDITSQGGYYGKAAKFNGESNELNKETALLSFDNNVYMEVMLRPNIEKIFTKTEDGDEIDIMNGGDGKFKLVLVNHKDFGLKVKAIVKKGDDKISVKSNGYFPDDGQWHKVAVSTLGGENKRISVYLNNILVNSIQGKSGKGDSTQEETFSVGRFYWGLMDDIKIYNVGGGTQVYLNPRDVHVLGQAEDSTRFINISPLGTIKNDSVIQIASTRLTGDLYEAPNYNGVPVDYDITRIRSSIPNAGFISFAGKMVEYEWAGDEIMTIVDDEIFGTDKPDQTSFQVIKPVIIRRNGTIQ